MSSSSASVAQPQNVLQSCCVICQKEDIYKTNEVCLFVCSVLLILQFFILNVLKIIQSVLRGFYIIFIAFFYGFHKVNVKLNIQFQYQQCFFLFFKISKKRVEIRLSSVETMTETLREAANMKNDRYQYQRVYKMIDIDTIVKLFSRYYVNEL